MTTTPTAVRAIVRSSSSPNDLISFSKDGGANFQGPVHSLSGKSTFESLAVESSLEISKNLNVNSEASISGTLYARSIAGIGNGDGNDSSLKIVSKSILTKQIDVSDKMSIKGIMKAEDGEFRNELRAKDLVVKGKLSIKGSGGVDANVINARKIVVSDNIETQNLIIGSSSSSSESASASASASASTAAGPKKPIRRGSLDIRDGTIRAYQIQSSNSITTPTLTCDHSIIKQTLQAQNITAKGVVTLRQLHVGMEGTMKNLYVDTIDVKRKLTVLGGALVALHGIQAQKDVNVNGTLIANKGRMGKGGMDVMGKVTALEVQVRQNISIADTLLSKHMEVRNGYVINMDAKKLDSEDVNVRGKMSIEDSGSFVSKGEFKAVKDAFVKGVLLIDGNISVSNGVYSKGEISTDGDLRYVYVNDSLLLNVDIIDVIYKSGYVYHNTYIGIFSHRYFPI